MKLPWVRCVHFNAFTLLRLNGLTVLMCSVQVLRTATLKLPSWCTSLKWCRPLIRVASMLSAVCSLVSCPLGWKCESWDQTTPLERRRIFTWNPSRGLQRSRLMSTSDALKLLYVEAKIRYSFEFNQLYRGGMWPVLAKWVTMSMLYILL